MAIRGLNSEGAPGPDGIPIFFLHRMLGRGRTGSYGDDRGLSGWEVQYEPDKQGVHRSYP